MSKFRNLRIEIHKLNKTIQNQEMKIGNKIKDGIEKNFQISEIKKKDSIMNKDQIKLT